MSKVDINICSCTGDCEDLKILDTNKKDDTKENLLEVAENKDLLEIETGVPFTKKTKVYPKRDKTKLNVKTFEEYKKFNEDIINNKFNLVNDDIEKLKNKDDILSEALTKKANLEDLEKKADRKDLDLKADKKELEGKADKSDLDLKADKTELDSKADKTELEKKVDKDFINGELESYSNTLTEFGKLLDDKADKSDLDKKADKSELDKKADKGVITENYLNFNINKVSSNITSTTIEVIIDNNRIKTYNIGQPGDLVIPHAQYIIKKADKRGSYRYYESTIMDFNRIQSGFMEINFKLGVIGFDMQVDQEEVILSNIKWVAGELA